MQKENKSLKSLLYFFIVYYARKNNHKLTAEKTLICEAFCAIINKQFNFKECQNIQNRISALDEYFTNFSNDGFLEIKGNRIYYIVKDDCLEELKAKAQQHNSHISPQVLEILAQNFCTKLKSLE
jgi:hypothetical protein